MPNQPETDKAARRQPHPVIKAQSQILNILADFKDAEVQAIMEGVAGILLLDGKTSPSKQAIGLAVAQAWDKAIEAVRDAGGDNEDFHVDAIREARANAGN